MALKKGDIIDEYKRYPESCGLLVKVLAGGAGFQKVVCCGHELTEDDVVPERIKKGGRKMGQKGVGIVIDEKKSYGDSCGLRVMIVDGGRGLERVDCCSHSLTTADEKEFTDLGMRNARKADPPQDEPAGPTGNA
jgi:hypothetical protein